MNVHIENTKKDFENNLSDHSKWEFLKYQIRKFTIKFSKQPAQNSRKRQAMLEKIVKELEEAIVDDISFEEQGIARISRGQWKIEKKRAQTFTRTP